LRRTTGRASGPDLNAGRNIELLDHRGEQVCDRIAIRQTLVPIGEQRIERRRDVKEREDARHRETVEGRPRRGKAGFAEVRTDHRVLRQRRDPLRNGDHRHGRTRSNMQ
jgi:hypothetical protein